MKIEEKRSDKMNEEKLFKERLSNLNERIYRKLIYFYEKKIPVHFCLVNGPGWKNGIIQTLNEKDYTLILNELREGELHFLFEEISINSIQPYKSPEELAKLREDKMNDNYKVYNQSNSEMKGGKYGSNFT
jgi:hypothetical protein